MNEEITLRDVADYLDRIGIQFMATIGLDGKPKVRPMQYMILEDDKLWFCTNAKKEVYAELQANPALELCGCKLEENEIQTPWIRFSADQSSRNGRISAMPSSRRVPCTRTLQRYAHQSHLQGVLSETHRRLDDQFRKRKRVGKESRFCQAHPFSVLKKLPVKYLPVILSEIPKDFRLPV